MKVSITIPKSYGYVILSTVIGCLFVSPTMMKALVVHAGSACGVFYPNVYASPGYHKHAEAYNRLLRGHQNTLESLGTFAFANLIGGLRHPIACTMCSVFYIAESYLYLGCILCLSEYIDKREADGMERFVAGWGAKGIGFFGSICATVSVAASMLGWW